MITDFESLALAPETVWDGSAATLGNFEADLVVGNFTFENTFSRNDWGFGITEAWSGFSYSRVTDNETPGFGNQYSCIAGSGAQASANYGVFYTGLGPGRIDLTASATLQEVLVCNATYPYLSMRDGDAFAKKFGGDTGDDPDYFILSILGYLNETVTDTIEFYLADYRFDDPAQDYLIDDWTAVDLSTLGEIDALEFSLRSSDNGDWGMNTPAYCCIDDLNGLDLEQLYYTSGDYWNGSTAALGTYQSTFEDGIARFDNTYTLSDWGFGTTGTWTNWAYSSMTDVSTAGYTNSFSAIPGQGANGSTTYAVCYNGGGVDHVQFEYPAQAEEIFVTNGTYPYLSMRDGDAFAKQFGGDSGDDPDFFYLRLTGWLDGQTTDSVDFYLADFRFEDNTLDYIIDRWTAVDLESLGIVDQITFKLHSSDMGDWGMNTPAYFFVDDLKMSSSQGSRETGNEEIERIIVYPNPAVDQVTIENLHGLEEIQLFGINGQLLKRILITDFQSSHQLYLSHLEAGLYVIKTVDGRGQIAVSRIVKQ